MSFGNTGSGSLFGNSNTASNPSGGGNSLFGNTANKPASNFFGGGATTGTTGQSTTGGGLFGNAGNASTAPSGGLFGNASGTTSTTTPSGGLFGNTGSTSTAAPASTPAAPTNNLFGGFNLPKPTEQGTKDAPKPATSNFFSQPGLSSTAPATSTPASGGLFGAKPADNAASAGNASTTSGTTPAPLFGGGGGLFGNKTAATSTTTPAPSNSGGFSLGGNKDGATPAPSGGLFGSKPAEKKEDKPAENAPAPSAGLFGSATTSKPEEKKDGPPSTGGGMSFGIGTNKPKEGDKPAVAPSATFGSSTLGSGASATTPNVAVPPPSMLKGKTIEEIVNKWSSELETHVREFNKFAAEVSMWDRALIENGNNLAALYSHVLAAERDQNEVDQSLDHIEQQQKDLSATLDSYEKVTQEIFGGQGGSLRALDTGPADTERDKNYMLATDLHTHLDDLSSSLTQMIDSVNSLSIPPGERSQDDPMTQISQILSSHLESLQWIDGAVREVEGKVTEVEKRVKESGHGSSLNGAGIKSRSYGFR
ncbi:FG-nucleoporin nsp1 [Stygiomarasmius scandens]|uniref:FG-nucleoporin nsp1 n=1 Tax=Marasmiellus scandens TaxID=2682957 RepID=A0ABR1K1S4_9AGAR